MPHSGDPKHRHETREAVPRYILFFAAGLGMAVVAGFLVSWGTLAYFKSHQNYAPPKSAISAGRVLPPPGVPQLQTHPEADLQVYLKKQHEILDSYGWVDRKNNVVRLPIQRAMNILLQQGLPVRNSKTPKGAVQPGEVQQYEVPQGYMPQN
ncbi:MAG: hypothetical protein EPN47_09325 [Acidobacteria bacterium]|nr:MAG: hypothetical protein EPN47_09325 [Acidobacteriota bacterium]